MEGQKLVKPNIDAKFKNIEMKFMYKENAPLLSKPAAQQISSRSPSLREKKYEVQVE